MRWALITAFCIAGVCVGGLVWVRCTASSEAWGRVEDYQRDQLAATQLILASVAARPGMRVLDVGAGVGYFSFKLARSVGSSGAVYASDVDPAINRRLRFEQLIRGAWNLHPVLLRQSTDTGVGRNSIDVALMVNVYRLNSCQRTHGARFLQNMADALRPNGRFVIAVDFIHRRGWRSPHGDRARCENFDVNQIVSLSNGAFTIAEQHTLTLSNYFYAAHEEPGFIATLRLAHEVTTEGLRESEDQR